MCLCAHPMPWCHHYRVLRYSYSVCFAPRYRSTGKGDSSQYCTHTCSVFVLQVFFRQNECIQTVQLSVREDARKDQYPRTREALVTSLTGRLFGGFGKVALSIKECDVLHLPPVRFFCFGKSALRVKVTMNQKVSCSSSRSGPTFLDPILWRKIGSMAWKDGLIRFLSCFIVVYSVMTDFLETREKDCISIFGTPYTVRVKGYWYEL